MFGLVVVALLLFLLLGASRLGEVGTGLAEGIRAFRKSLDESEERSKKRKKKKPRAREIEDDPDAVWERRRVKARRQPEESDEADDDEGS